TVKLVSGKNDIEECCRTYFQDLGKEPEPLPTWPQADTCVQWKQDRGQRCLIDNISMDEVRKVISSDPLTDPEIDGITYAALKISTEPTIQLITNIINTIIQSEIIPKEISTGEIFLLYKGKDSKCELNNYRGITLLSVIYKLITTLIKERVSPVVLPK